MGALVLGTASGVVILLTALSMGLPVAAAIAAQSVGGIGATLVAALVQTVLAARRDVEMTVPADALAGAEQAQTLYGAAAVDAASGVVTVSARGPVFAAWALPGVRVP